MSLPLKKISELNLSTTVEDTDFLILNKNNADTKVVSIALFKNQLNLSGGSTLYINDSPPPLPNLNMVWIKPTIKEFQYFNQDSQWSLLFKDITQSFLSDLLDVADNPPVNNSVLQFDTTLNKWTPKVLNSNDLTGLLSKSVYDTNNNGIVDNSERLNNNLPSFYLNRSNHTGQINVDVLTTTQANQGDYLKWNGAFWSAQPVLLQNLLSSPPTINDSGKSIIWNGSTFALESTTYNIYSNGNILPRRNRINFRGSGVAIADDSINAWTDILITGVADNTGIQKVEVSSNSNLVGSRKRLNFISGTATVLNISDNPVSDRIDITINNTAAGEFNTASNVGSGTGIFAQKIGTDLQFKTLVQGTNIVLTNNANTVSISTSAESNTASNVGVVGEGIFKQKAGSDLQFKRLIAGSNVNLNSTTDAITISSNYTPTTSLIVQDEGTTVSTTAGTLNFKGSNVTATNNSNVIDIEITNPPALLNIKNQSTIVSTTVNTLNFVGAGVNVTGTGNELDINILSTGEVNTASNLGTGVGIYNQKVGTDLRFRSLIAGQGISLSSTTNSITINGTNSLIIKDEGTLLTNTPTEFNFTGAGVTASNSSGIVTINVPAASTSDNSVNYLTSNLQPNTHEQADLVLSRANVILNITSNRACRVRFYLNTIYRTSDLGRPLGIEPSGEHGLLLEVVTSNSNSSIDCSPLPVVAALGSGSNSIPITITNLDNVTGIINLTISYLSL